MASLTVDQLIFDRDELDFGGIDPDELDKFDQRTGYYDEEEGEEEDFSHGC